MSTCGLFREIYQDLCVIMSSVFIADLAITKGKQDVKRVLERQKMTEEAQTLQKFVNKKEELDQEINREIDELKLMSDNCEGDIDIIGMSIVLCNNQINAWCWDVGRTLKELVNHWQLPAFSIEAKSWQFYYFRIVSVHCSTCFLRRP